MSATTKSSRGKGKAKAPTSPASPVATNKSSRRGRGKKEGKNDEENTPTTPQQSPRPPRAELHFSNKKTPADISPGRFSNPGSNIKLQLDDESPATPSLRPAALFDIKPSVRKVYKLVQKSTGALGGNGYDDAIYGELTIGSMQKVLNYMMEHCELSKASRFIDVGSGLGKPNFHAAQDPCVQLSIGIELEHIRWQLAMHNLKHVTSEMTAEAADAIASETLKEADIKLLPRVHFMQGDIFDVETTDPFTHIYMYDLGFPPPLQKQIANLFNNSTHAQYLISYRTPRRVLDEYGYQVEFIGKIGTTMTGSGEGHTCYFYKRTSTPKPLVARAGTTILHIPAREGLDDDSSDVVCANKFKACVSLAVGDFDTYKAGVAAQAEQMMNSGRPKRVRKPRVL